MRSSAGCRAGDILQVSAPKIAMGIEMIAHHSLISAAAEKTPTTAIADP
jgi:hypothetical protein